jgi:hypothetical protein
MRVNNGSNLLDIVNYVRDYGKNNKIRAFFNVLD